MKTILASLLLAVVVAASFGTSLVGAQSGNPPSTPPAGGMVDGQGRGRGPWSPGPFGEGELHEEMITVLAGKLGLTVNELNAKLDAGTTIAQLASDKGMTVEEFRTMMQEAREEAIALGVKNGTLSQEQADWLNSRGNLLRENGMGFGRGLFGEGLMHDEMVTVMAGKLGLTEAELNTKLEAGETIADLASAKGMTVVEFRQMMVDARSEAINLAVKNGTLTQEQADWMKSRGERMRDHMGGMHGSW